MAVASEARPETSEVTGVLDALRGYVQLATGLTEVTVARAREAAAAVIAQGIELAAVRDVPGGDQATDAAKVAATQVQGLADDLLETSKANREMLVGLIRTEVDRAAGRMGFVREEELAAVRRHVARLETQLVDIRSSLSAAPAAASAAAGPAGQRPRGPRGPRSLPRPHPSRRGRRSR